MTGQDTGQALAKWQQTKQAADAAAAKLEQDGDTKEIANRTSMEESKAFIIYAKLFFRDHGVAIGGENAMLGGLNANVSDDQGGNLIPANAANAGAEHHS